MYCLYCWWAAWLTRAFHLLDERSQAPVASLCQQMPLLGSLLGHPIAIHRHRRIKARPFSLLQMTLKTILLPLFLYRTGVQLSCECSSWNKIRKVSIIKPLEIMMNFSFLPKSFCLIVSSWKKCSKGVTLIGSLLLFGQVWKLYFCVSLSTWLFNQTDQDKVVDYKGDLWSRQTQKELLALYVYRCVPLFIVFLAETSHL